MEKTPVDLYNDRYNRIDDAINLKIPDQIPIVLDFGLLTSRYAGVPIKEIYYDHVKLGKAYEKSIPHFGPDAFMCLHFISGGVWETVGTKTQKWPGHGGPDDHVNQYIESDYMKEDEYDEFLSDPADFIVRKYLPRVCEVAEPFEDFPHLVGLSGISGGGAISFTKPEVVEACKKIYKSGLIAKEWDDAKMACVRHLKSLGYPAIYQRALFQPPFDYFGDMLRGVRGIMLDMLRQPDKLHAAMDRILPQLINRAISIIRHSDISTSQIFFGGPHKGAEGYMSLKHFEEFYWPGMKAIILALIDKGVTPWLFWEGDYVTSRLEYLLDLPEGKVVHHFDRGDIFRAKEVLGGHHCIAGGVSPILLQAGSVTDIEEHCKKLVDVVGKDGGYILSTSCALDEAKPESVKAMIDFMQKYGVYR